MTHRSHSESPKPLTPEQMQHLAETLSNVDAAIALLPQEEQDAYHAAQESVIEARRSAQRIEGQLWIG